MKQYAIASLLLIGLTAPALAANVASQDSRDTASNFSYVAKDHWAVDDTVGNCAVVEFAAESERHQWSEDSRQ